MFVYGVSLADVECVVRDVSGALYDGNFVIRTGADRSNRAGPRATFTLRAIDTAGCGSKGSASSFAKGTEPRGRRRTISACWHAHYDVLAELFTRFPGARVVTAIATYTGQTFRDCALATAAINMGSRAFPVTAPDCCERNHADHVGDFGSTLSGDAMRPNTSVEYFLDKLGRVLASH